MFMNIKIQFCNDLTSFQIYLHNQGSPTQNIRKLFCGYQQTNSKVYIGRQVNQNNQYNIEGEQNWRNH